MATNEENQREIAVEVEAARDDGRPWTPYRPFKNFTERVGAMKCCWPNCNEPSEYVSYCIDFPGRVVHCTKHVQRYLRKEDGGIRSENS